LAAYGHTTRKEYALGIGIKCRTSMAKRLVISEDTSAKSVVINFKAYYYHMALI
jgi:hypothetical protein